VYLKNALLEFVSQHRLKVRNPAIIFKNRVLQTVFNCFQLFSTLRALYTSVNSAVFSSPALAYSSSTQNVHTESMSVLSSVYKKHCRVRNPPKETSDSDASGPDHRSEVTMVNMPTGNYASNSSSDSWNTLERWQFMDRPRKSTVKFTDHARQVAVHGSPPKTVAVHGSPSKKKGEIHRSRPTGGGSWIALQKNCGGSWIALERKR